MKTIKATIAGATGYTGGELIRILLNHPQVEIESLLSTSMAGEAVSSVHKDLYGDCHLHFTDKPGNPDVIFLCLGHGLSRDFLHTNHVPACKIIDLSHDFRIKNTFEEKTFVYGLSELFRNEIAHAEYVANPGCFATAIILALSPLASLGMFADDVHIHALTGATGAGKQPDETSHFSYRTSNISIYKPFTHQHVAEIQQTLSVINGNAATHRELATKINFIPMRGDFSRGIFAAVLTKLPEGAEEENVRNVYKTYYSASPFVHFSDTAVSLKEVVNTNKALLNINFHDGYIHITSVIDNLLKGASGQAVQNMNLMFGLPEDCGLRLKSAAF
ncbi:MAG: N-acetyl-gamma-glutamyl-phosphate reductase [Prevotellaceae bacterium]|jgi:N-acetyl-gamma-glutamyl-phosphate reductase|nr:N-acetyl-gamma-glutamyl-phosphate reductase [Prevotellaceae bacterium]